MSREMSLKVKYYKRKAGQQASKLFIKAKSKSNYYKEELQGSAGATLPSSAAGGDVE
jgi:hypothetical protein